MYNDGHEPMRSNRNTLTFELAINLRHICGFDRNLLDQVIPCYDGFSEQEKMACINSALGERPTQMPKRLKDVLAALRQEKLKQAKLKGVSAKENEALINALDEANAQDDLFYYKALPKMPQGGVRLGEGCRSGSGSARDYRHLSGHWNAGHGRENLGSWQDEFAEPHLLRRR